ncbi:MAG: methionine biosynthesis protein MetW [Gammaproteobacteria bacterium]|nr:methionine biosynthesis protein MetW [Gammaproteobacteria bacterium]
MKQADDIIIDLVNPNARVLDLGCGDGDLLCRLRQTKSVTGYGVEIEHTRIEGCLARGVNVIEHDIDAGLDRFPTNSFDIVIMNETLQAISEPRTLVREMLRIGEECVVTFPNFAYWQCRKQLFFGGRMPVSKHLPNEWYDTPNIHLCTIHDFDTMCAAENVRVITRHVFDQHGRETFPTRMLPNVLGVTAFYRLGRPT